MKTVVLMSAVLDSDGDGIRDSLDQCPSTPETWNRYQDEDGCPDNPSEADSDFDGILDSVDQCPLDRERYNGFQDEDGCPDYPDLLLV